MTSGRLAASYGTIAPRPRPDAGRDWLASRCTPATSGLARIGTRRFRLALSSGDLHRRRRTASQAHPARLIRSRRQNDTERPPPTSVASTGSAGSHGEDRLMAKETIADLIAATLADAGVKRIWGVTGDSLNGLNDSLRRLGRIAWMHVRHEEVAAFAAGGEAAVTGELAVCAGSCGPGNLHLINGLFDCHRSHVPVLAIAAHIPSLRDRPRLLPGDAPAGAVPRMQPLLRARLHPRAAAAGPGNGDPHGGGRSAASRWW